MMPLALGPGAERRTRLGFLLAVALVIISVIAKPILTGSLDPDCFWHLRVGEQLRSDGIGPLIDHLSFASMQSPWSPYSWLAELGMVRLWEQLGWRGAVLAQSIFQALFVIGIAAACRSRSAAPTRAGIHHALRGPGVTAQGALQAAIATGFGAFFSVSFLTFRPATPALVLLATSYWLVIRDRQLSERSWAIWWVVPLTMLSINVHLYAIFIPLGLVAMLAGSIWERHFIESPADRMEAERRIERYALLVLTTAVACTLTPLLPGTIVTGVRYLFEDPMVASEAMRGSSLFHSGRHAAAAAGLLSLFAVCVVMNRGRLRASEWILLFAATLLTLRLGRLAPIFAIVAAPMLAATLPSFSDRLLGRPVVCAAMTAVMIAGWWRVLSAFPHRQQTLSAWLNRSPGEAAAYPCDAADFVAGHVVPVHGRLINESSWGGYLEWRLGAQYQTFLDSRTQLFTPAFWNATYLCPTADRRKFLGEVVADAAVLPTRKSVFHDALTQLGWKVAFRDEHAEVLLPPTAKASLKSTEWPSASILFGDGQ